MRIAAVIAEYDPFHNGHACHLQKTREAGADAVVAIVSGNFVQRGEPAAFSKWARAEAAVRSGADLIVELPVYWAAAGAQRFAGGAVSIAAHLGCVDMLSFGSECGDADRLRQAADALGTLKVSQDLLRSGMSFAAAREATFSAQYGDLAHVLRTPNDTLAVEYMCAADRCGASFSYNAVQRGTPHDGQPDGACACASYIRRELSDTTIRAYCPASAAEVFLREMRENRAGATLQKVERALLMRLRTSSAQQIAALPDVSEGLENRILSAAKTADSLQALYAAVKSKRYSHARIRRILLSFALGLRECDVPPDVPYVRVLAIGARGEELLHRIKQTADLPLVTKASAVDAMDETAKRVFAAEERASELYAVLQPAVQNAASERTTPLFVLEYK